MCFYTVEEREEGEDGEEGLGKGKGRKTED